MISRLKSSVAHLVDDKDINDKTSHIFDIFLIALIFANVVIIIWETFPVSAALQKSFDLSETISLVIFSLEYLCRIWTAPLNNPDVPPMKARISYAASFMGIVDLLAILPFYLPVVFSMDLRILRVLRVLYILRLLKINRYNDSFSKIIRVIRKKLPQLISSIFVVCLLILISGVLMYHLENSHQPDKFDNAFSSFWWAVATFTTVGYGDIYPVTPAGKLLGAMMALLGIGLVAVPTGIISSGFVEEDICEIQEEAKKFCPYCGKKI